MHDVISQDFSVKQEKKSHGRNQFGANAASSADPRCPFKHPLFFLISPRVQPPHPSAHRAANQISSYLRSEPPVPLVYRCVPGRHLRQGRRDGCWSCRRLRCYDCDWWRMRWKQISGQLSQRETDPKTTRQEAAETPGEVRAQVVECREENLPKCETISRETFRRATEQRKGCFHTEDLLLKGFLQSTLSGKPTRSLSATQVSSCSSVYLDKKRWLN